MTKKSGVFDVQLDLKNLVVKNETQEKEKVDSITIEKALGMVTQQMEISGFRKRTISDYNLHMAHYCEITGANYIEDITVESIYEWLGSMKVSNSTKLIRLKCMKAMLGKFFDNGLIQIKFWKSINMKVDKSIKKGSTTDDINKLLSLLDLNSFVG